LLPRTFRARRASPSVGIQYVRSAKCSEDHSPALRKKAPEEREHGGHARRVQLRDRLKRHPQERQHSDAVHETRDRVPPARSSINLARGAPEQDAPHRVRTPCCGRSRKGGVGKPDAFNFAGFSHVCERARAGRFRLAWRTRGDCMRAKLGEIRKSVHPLSVTEQTRLAGKVGAGCPDRARPVLCGGGRQCASLP
jgi:hypothetical protein